MRNNPYQKFKFWEKQEQKEKEIIEDNLDEWIWVTGYKGTNKDIQCKDYQFSLNETYECPEESVKLCEGGFHFCQELTNVFRFYQIDGENRFFEVKALVRKFDIEDVVMTYIRNGFGTAIMSAPWQLNDGTKLTSKKIILLKELNFDDENFRKAIQDKMPYIESEKDYLSLRNITYKQLATEKFKRDMKKFEFSDAYIQAQLDELDHSRYYDFVRKVHSYIDDVENTDLLIYLLEKFKRNPY